MSALSPPSLEALLTYGVLLVAAARGLQVAEWISQKIKKVPA